jgi:hypothetical protein
VMVMVKNKSDILGCLGVPSVVKVWISTNGANTLKDYAAKAVTISSIFTQYQKKSSIILQNSLLAKLTSKGCVTLKRLSLEPLGSVTNSGYLPGIYQRTSTLNLVLRSLMLRCISGAKNLLLYLANTSRILNYSCQRPGILMRRLSKSKAKSTGYMLSFVINPDSLLLGIYLKQEALTQQLRF